MLKRIRNIYIVLHEGIDTTAPTLSKFSNDDPTLHRASSYPLCNPHSHTSTLTPLPSPEVTAHTTEDVIHTPATSPVLLQTSEFALLTSLPASLTSPRHSPPE